MPTYYELHVKYSSTQHMSGEVEKMSFKNRNEIPIPMFMNE